MRPLILLVILSVAAATSAGCFGKDEDPPATSPTTGTGTTPMTGTPPTGATPATPTPGGNVTTPTKPAPTEVFSGNADFTPGQPPVPPPVPPTAQSRPNPFTVPPLYTTLTLNVTWALTAPGAIAAPGIAVTVTDAAGTAIATCAGPSGPVQTAPEPCSMSGAIPATGGEFSANYVGEAAGLGAAVSVVAS